MPIPDRTAAESRDEFISRCMGDTTMVVEFPDVKQRYAVCIDKSKQ